MRKGASMLKVASGRGGMDGRGAGTPSSSPDEASPGIWKVLPCGVSGIPGIFRSGVSSIPLGCGCLTLHGEGDEEIDCTRKRLENLMNASPSEVWGMTFFGTSFFFFR